MMRQLQYIFVFGIAIVLIAACSVKKDTALSRGYHALTTKYNILFNGKEAFKKGLDEVHSKHKDNYWKLLTIEPITFEDNTIAVPTFDNSGGPSNSEATTQNQTPFDKAEEKAVKAIQTHSMNIYGRERNPQIDDAYLLLGKARYYTQRFIPAIEAFNYIIATYPYASLINETKIWRAKTNVRLGNEDLAVESLKILLKSEEELPEEIREQIHTTLAMAYTEMDSVHKVKEHLTKATRTFENKEQGARNLFILGQLYSFENKKDSAAMVFEKLANLRRAPYKYKIHANIELAKNTLSDSSSTALIKKFKKLVKDIDNRPYLDELYFQIGNLEENRDSTARAITNYKRSLRAKKGSAYQKTHTYERMGNIYFTKANYILASAYYDSVLQVAGKEDKELRIRRVRRKHKSLASLIQFEEIVKVNDSVLRLAALPEKDRIQFFEDYIAKIKKEDEERAQQQLNAISFGNAFGGGTSVGNTNKGKWYFYNTQALGFGKAEFQNVWGNRPLEDDWRLSDKTVIKSTQDQKKTEKNKVLKRYQLSTYLDNIPTDQKAIDSLIYQRNNALYELGLIYKEQFTNETLAIQNLERLLTLNPDKTLLLPTNYHLYQVYNSIQNKEKAAFYKKVVLEQYGDSKYAQIIKNPKKNITEEKSIDDTEKKYKEIYYQYKEDAFEEVVKMIDEVLPTIKESKLIPKFELLKAYAIGKYENKATYKKAMEFVALNYGNTEEGKKAKEIIKRLN